MKRSFVKLLTGIVVLFLALTFYPATGIADVYNDFEYQMYSNYTEITSYTGAGGAITIPEHVPGYPSSRPVTTINRNAFTGNTNITSIAIPSTVTSIPPGTLGECANLRAVSVGTPGSPSVIGDYWFMGCTGIETVSISDSVTAIGEQAFYGCTGLTAITLPPGLQSAASGAFANCTGLASITIPQSVTTFSYCLTGCSNLKTATVQNGTTAIGEGWFAGLTGLETVNIPSTVTSIGGFAFQDCAALASIQLPDHTASIGEGAFQGCTGLTSLTLPGSVTYMGPCFAGCSNLRSIVIGDGMNSIGEYWFQGMSGLRSVSLPGSLTGIGNNAFSGTGLTSVTIPGSVRTMGLNVFYGCADLETVVIEDGVPAIGNYCFTGASSLRSISIPGSVTAIGLNAFSGTGFTSFTIPRGLVSMGIDTFSGCDELYSIDMEDGLAAIGPYWFSGISSLQSVSIPGSVTAIGDFAFAGCSGLSEVIMPENLISIGQGAFQDCTGLTSFVIPASLTALYSNAFSGCANLHYIAIENGAQSIQDYWFSDIANPFTLTVPESVTYIGDSAFANCAGLTEIYLYCPKPAVLSDTLFDSAAPGFTMYCHVKHASSWSGYNDAYNKQIFCVGTFYSMDGGNASKAMFCLDSYARILGSPDTPSRQGYVFDSWYKESELNNKWNFATAVMTDDFEAYAGWIANDYTVTFDATGGTVSPAGKTVTYDQPYGALPTPARTGYSFAGWYTQENGGGTHITESTIVKITTGITLYANWQPVPSTVTFNAAGGTVNPASKVVTYDQPYGTLPTPARTGYAFAGWYTQVNGGGTQIIATTIVKITTGITLYANWQPVPYTVTFNAAGGTVSPASKVVTYDQAYGALPTPARAGYTFIGWYTLENGGGTHISESTIVKITSGITLYANWQPIPYTVTFNATGGTVNPTGKTVTYDQAYGALPTPARDGYTFAGWYTQENGGGTQISESTIVKITADATLYANWQRIPDYTVTFNATGGTVSPTSKTVTYDQTYGALPKPARAGYSFAGWYTLKNGGGDRVTDSTIVKITADITLYANWQHISPDLSGIKLSSGNLSPLFSASRTNYTVNLGENTAGVKITPVKEYDGATMTIDKKALSSKTITVANGKSATCRIAVKYGKTTKTYTLTIKRAKSTNNKLASLTASAGTFDKPFDPNVTIYKLTLPEGVSKVTLKAGKAISLETLSPTTKTLVLKNGQTSKVKFTVKAQSGALRTYTVTVIRLPSSDIGLKYLKTNSKQCPLVPAFSNGAGQYKVTLPAGTGSITIYASARGYMATVYIDGVKRTLKKVTLSPGANVTVVVMVKAQSGAVARYTLNIKR